MKETRKQKIDRQRGHASDRMCDPIRAAIDSGELVIAPLSPQPLAPETLDGLNGLIGFAQRSADDAWLYSNSHTAQMFSAIAEALTRARERAQRIAALEAQLSTLKDGLQRIMDNFDEARWQDEIRAILARSTDEQP